MKQFCRRRDRGATFSTESADFCLSQRAEIGSKQTFAPKAASILPNRELPSRLVNFLLIAFSLWFWILSLVTSTEFLGLVALRAMNDHA
jgi:hypothetical protein